MGFWTRPGPWVEVIVVCLRSELLDEAVCSLPKTPKGSEGDGHEVEVELLVLDDLVSRAAFVVGVDVGGRTTCSPTRRVVDVSVDGRVRDADVQDRFAVVREARCSQVTFAFAVVVGVVSPSELGDLRRLNVDASPRDEWP